MSTSAAPHILVVDDSEETLAMLSDALQLTGMQVSTARSGIDALHQVDETVPDLVLMDAIMAGMNGFDACQILKEERGHVDVPVIFMTGHNESDHMARAFASGAVDYIVKPIHLDEMFARINVHLSNARRAKSAREALDRTGRRLVACNAEAQILWSTPQAADLLSRNGMRSTEGERLPLEVKFWLSSDQQAPSDEGDSSLRIGHGEAGGIEFRLLESDDDADHLLHLVDASQGSEEDRLARMFDLTFREAEVLLWVAHSKSNKEIAEILDLSPRTVNKHLEQIFVKLGVENRTAAATRATRVLLDWG